MHVDLTQPIETGMQTYPGDPEVAVRPHATDEENEARVSALECGSHTGTHVDAPAHTEPDGKTLDGYPSSGLSSTPSGSIVATSRLASRFPHRECPTVTPISSRSGPAGTPTGD